MRFSDGFTIVELMVAISIVAVVATVGAPYYGDFVQGRRLSAQSAIISSAFRVARAEALAQLRDVSVCWNPTNAQITVDTVPIAPRSMAVYIPAEAANGGNPAIALDIIKNLEYSDERTLVVDNDADNCIVYNSQGRVENNATVLFGICKEAGDSTDSQAVTVTLAGRAIVQLNQNGNNPLINCA